MLPTRLGRWVLGIAVSCAGAPFAEGVDFPAGLRPRNLVFDGANIWVASAGTVTKLRASDGANLGTFLVSGAEDLAFDGTHVWVTTNTRELQGPFGDVVKLRASDGAWLHSIFVGPSAGGVAFDGANLWVGTNGGLMKIRTSDHATVLVPISEYAEHLLFDGTSLWVGPSGSDEVIRLRPSDGFNLGASTVGLGPRGMAFDGTNVWVANAASQTVTKLRAGDGATLGTFPAGTGPYDVAFDGSNIWVTNHPGNTVTVLRASDGTALGSVATGNKPYGAVFDGANVWVTNEDSNTVSKLSALPLAFIDTPLPGGTFAVRETLTLSGRSLDAAGLLPPGSMSWTVLLHHEAHSHTLLGPVTGNNIPFLAPAPEDLAAAVNSYIEVRLTATDAGGATSTATRDIHPRKVPVTFATSPPGLGVSVKGVPLTGPQTVTSWENWVLQATAPPWQTLGPDLYVFSSWSSGVANPVAITTPAAPATYTATYQLSTDVGPQGYFSVPPCRLVDTRDPTGPRGGPAVLAGTTRSFDLHGVCGIPATARALAVNVAVTSPTANGSFRLHAADEQLPGTSTIGFSAGQTRGNNAIVRLSGTGALSAFCSMSSGSAQLVLDVVGYFE